MIDASSVVIITTRQAIAMQTTSIDSSGIKRILLIDDDPSFLAYSTFILTQSGYQVFEARDGCEALRRIEEYQSNGISLDLLVTDIRMPGMSGVSLLRQLSVLNIRLPVLIISGFLDPAGYRALKAMSYLDILVKPFKPRELIEYIERLTCGTGTGDRGPVTGDLGSGKALRADKLVVQPS